MSPSTAEVLREGMTALRKLPALMEPGSLEERKEFMHAFIAGLTVHPDEQRLDIQMRKIPAAVLPQPGNSSVGVVAGARYATLQTNLLARSVPLRGQEIVVPRAA